MKRFFGIGCTIALLCGCGQSSTSAPNSTAATANQQQADSIGDLPPQDEPLMSAGGDGLTDSLSAGRLSASQTAFGRLCDAYVKGDGDAWSRAEQELLSLGSSIEPTLVAAITTGAKHERELAAMMLAQIDVRSDEAKTALKLALQDESSLVCSNAALALCAMGDRSAELLQTVEKLLSDAAPEGRETGAMLVGNLGSEATELVPTVSGLLGDDEETVRNAAARALGLLGPLSSKYVENLRAVAISDPSTDVRASAEQAINQISDSSLQPGSGSVIPAGGEASDR